LPWTLAQHIVNEVSDYLPSFSSCKLTLIAA
jgi:hypothetical protein